MNPLNLQSLFMLSFMRMTPWGRPRCGRLEAIAREGTRLQGPVEHL
jgi:hypothetical protein